MNIYEKYKNVYKEVQLKHCIAILLVFSISACGGGGGGDSSTADEAQIIVEDTQVTWDETNWNEKNWD